MVFVDHLKDLPVNSVKRTRPGTTRLSTPIKSFFSSKSFWKFSILMRLPWSCSTTSDTSARAAVEQPAGVKRSLEIDCWDYSAALDLKRVKSSTSAVPEIHMSSWVMFAQALQELLVMAEAVQRPQNEDIERDVADLLQLKVPAETLQPAGRPARLLQLQQDFRLFMQVCRQGLWIKV